MIVFRKSFRITQVRVEKTIEIYIVKGGRKMTINEMTLEGLPAQETLLLETANSIYRFSVIDAPNGIGKLSGGIFGNNPTTASFLSSVSAQEEFQAEGFGKVKIGSRAIFVYQSNEGLNQFVTSPIKKLTHSKHILF
jgi:hypothetical protein